jgi:two-component system LytT family response regulator
MELKAIIVDDEERGLIVLQQLLEVYCTGVQVVGAATSIADAMEKIAAAQPDVVFLDIEMPGGNGFKLLEQIEEVTFDVIFVTAYHQYAIKAIRFAALDYLLKPVKIDELQAALERVRKNREKKDKDKYSFLKEAFSKANTFNRIMLQSLDQYHLIKLDDILYCKASDNYTYFYTRGGKHYLVTKQLKEYEELLSTHNFFRIHKTYLVNIDHVERVNKTDGVTVVMSNQDELPVAFRKKEEFIERLKNL